MDSHQREYQKRYREQNRDRLLAQKQIYYEKNRARILARINADRERKRQYDRQYHRKNRKTHREKKRTYQRKYRSVPVHKLAHNLRNRLSKFIRRRSGRDSTEVLLGCPFDEFAKHIERQFRSGMTWRNYGRVWHIDHIIPVTAFDLMDEGQLRRCFHFSNLRPLLARQNLRKNNKITDPQFRLPL